jgi:hypothetical protein
MLKPPPPIERVSPDYPRHLFQRAVPITPADQTDAYVDCFSVHAAFPALRSGRRPHCFFRGLLRLHSRYGPLDRSAAQSGICHEAPARPVTQPIRSSATRSIDNSLGGLFLHWQHAPSGRTVGQHIYVDPQRGRETARRPTSSERNNRHQSARVSGALIPERGSNSQSASTSETREHRFDHMLFLASPV